MDSSFPTSELYLFIHVYLSQKISLKYHLLFCYDSVCVLSRGLSPGLYYFITFIVVISCIQCVYKTYSRYELYNNANVCLWRPWVKYGFVLCVRFRSVSTISNRPVCRCCRVCPCILRHTRAFFNFCLMRESEQGQRSDFHPKLGLRKRGYVRSSLQVAYVN